MANQGIVGVLKVLLGLNTAEFSAGVKKAKGEAQGLESDFKSFGKSFAGAFLPVAGVAGAGFALAAFAKQAFATAGRVTDLADQTGLTTQSIQEMQAAANLTSTSLESFTNAAFKLGVNLAGGTDRVRAAVDALGLSYSSLRDQSPDEQFRTIASALGEVEDVQLRNKLAVDLFGRSAKEILPAIAQGYGDIADAAGKAGDAQIRALDEAADAWASFWNGAKALAIDVLGQVVINFRDSWNFMMQAPRKAMEEWSAALEAMGLKAAVLPKVFGEARTAASLLPAPIKSITMSLEEQNRVEKELTSSVKSKIAATVKGYDDAAAAIKRAAEAQKRFNAELAEFDNKVKSLTSTAPLLFMGDAKFSQPIKEATKSAAELSEEMYGWHPPIQASVFGMVEFKAAVKEVRSEVGNLGSELKTNLLDILGNIPQIIASSLQGGGGITGAIKSIASQIGSEIGAQIGEFIGGKLGKKIGAAIGSFAGALVDKVKGWFGFGTDEAEKFRKELLKQFGTFDALEKKAQSVGMTLVDVWKGKGKKGAEELRAAIEKLNVALDDHKQKLEAAREALEDEISAARSELDGLIGDAKEMGYVFDKEGNLVSVSFEKMKQVADKFGVSTEALGKTFHTARLAAGWKEVVDAVELLGKGGTDAGTILTGLKDEIGHLVTESIKFGTKIPENMRPWIQNLIDTDQLILDNGQHITDISQINFGPPIKSEFDIVKDAILQVISKLDTLIGRLDDLIRRLDNLPSPEAPWHDWEDPPQMPDYNLNPPIIPEPVTSAKGRLARRPMLSWIGEGGEPELVGPVDFMSRALRGALNQIGPSTALASLGGLTPALAGASATAQPVQVTHYHHHSYEISAVDGESVARIVPKLTQEQNRLYTNNPGGVRTDALDALGISRSLP